MYIITLEEQLTELKKCPMPPNKDVLDDYTKSVAFLKGLTITEKLPSVTDKVVASQFLSPCSSPYGDTVSKEIRHKVASQYSNQVRDELLTNKLLPANESVSTEKNEEFENPASTLRQRKTELLSTIKTNTTPTHVQDFDGVISNEQQTQEEITNNLLTMAKTMKEQTMSANSIIRQDLITLEKANILAEENQTNLQTQTQKLQERSGFCTRCWVWLFLLLVCMSFIAMIVFMRLFKKKKTS
ncbi:vesicle transport protein USE1-like isoform X4 [Daphnia pulex]|uniref:vesicle transport protein USE1-like isoform X4 n=1 Tax=Daphnia pulex TaxID=6669 RepID=UPI001EDDE745|nr:vesicle transport protein USE1-like isoform X4 [Daphnia pulex]